MHLCILNWRDVRIENSGEWLLVSFIYIVISTIFCSVLIFIVQCMSIIVWEFILYNGSHEPIILMIGHIIWSLSLATSMTAGIRLPSHNWWRWSFCSVQLVFKFGCGAQGSYCHFHIFNRVHRRITKVAGICWWNRWRSKSPLPKARAWAQKQSLLFWWNSSCKDAKQVMIVAEMSALTKKLSIQFRLPSGVKIQWLWTPNFYTFLL